MSDIAYPPAPWSIHGHGLIVFSYPSKFTANQELPLGFACQSLLWGRTLAGYYLAEYDTPLDDRETSSWSEWGNIKGLIRFPQGNGFWIDSMAVDSKSALDGGKEIWGLNKFPGLIEWQTQNRQGKAHLTVPEGKIELAWKEWGPSLNMNPIFWFVTRNDGRFARYSVEMNAMFRISRVDIKRRDLPAFASLCPKNYWAIRFTDAEIRISAPH